MKLLRPGMAVIAITQSATEARATVPTDVLFR